MLTPHNRPQPIGHLNGEPIYAIDALETTAQPAHPQPASNGGPTLEDILDGVIELVEDLEVANSEIIAEIRRATSQHESTPEMSVNQAGIVTSLNRRAAIAGLTLIHLKAILGTADQVLR